MFNQEHYDVEGSLEAVSYSYFVISDSIRKLLSDYTIAPESSKKKVKIIHPGFVDLQKDTKKLIQAILKDLYKDDLEILRKAFIEKFEFYLRLVNDSLQDAECQDPQLLGEIASIREQITNIISESELEENDYQWLKKIGFTAIDIFEIRRKAGVEGVIKELRENVDEYKLIVGEVKYIAKILKFSKGLDKLKRLRSFYRNYSDQIIDFNGSHLAKIVRGAGWEEKLRYFEDEEKLKRMKEAGFDGSHLAQIVMNADWEEKLRKVLTEEVLDLLAKKIITHNKLAKLCMSKNWREEIEILIEGDF